MRSRKHLRIKVIILNRKVYGVKNIRNKNSRNLYIYYGVDSVMYYYNIERYQTKIYHFQNEEKQK